MTTRADQGCYEYLLSQFLEMRDQYARAQNKIIELQGRMFEQMMHDDLAGLHTNEQMIAGLRDAIRTRWAGVSGDKDKEAARWLIHSLNDAIVYFGGTREEVGG